MSRDEDRDERGFKVEDRRRFDPEGNARGGASAAEVAAAAERAAAADAAATGKPPLPEIDFSTFILSLVTSAVMHLGDAPHPDGAVRRELDLAKQTIDIIGMLRDKTQGNLSPEETRLLEEVLYDLRLRFVGLAR